MSNLNSAHFNLERLPKDLQVKFRELYNKDERKKLCLRPNEVYLGDARTLLPQIEPNSVAVSVWSPPYFVGKDYESYLTFENWQNLLSETIAEHFPIIVPGGFLVVNIADILCFKDEKMPRVSAEAVNRKRASVTKENVLRLWSEYPHLNRRQIAEMLGCSEQTVDRRLNGNNIRGGKHGVQTKVKIVGGLLEEWAERAGFYLYDRRVWVKDAAWDNSQWASLSYRAVDEFEYLYFFWKPGITKYDRCRLSSDEWKNWGSRAVWNFPSVRANDDHEAKFPLELPRRVIKLLSEPNDIVLDCFIGSGTTAVAAVELERQFIGIEIEQKYVELARLQIEQKRMSVTNYVS